MNCTAGCHLDNCTKIDLISLQIINHPKANVRPVLECDFCPGNMKLQNCVGGFAHLFFFFFLLYGDYFLAKRLFTNITDNIFLNK